MNGNSNKKYNQNHESETESDVEEIAQEDYYSVTDDNSSKSPSPYRSPNLSPKNNISHINSQLTSPNSINGSTEKTSIFSQLMQKFNFFKNNTGNQTQNNNSSINSSTQNVQSQIKPSNLNNLISSKLSSPKNSPNKTQISNNSSSFQQNYQPNPIPQQNLTSQGQIITNISSTFSLHPSVKIPKYYTFQFHGFQVKFPYEQPYEAQKQLISSTLLAFKTGQNALLESPTGTGKSLALLSAALSFLETCPTIMKLYYTSRTHIQLQQLVSEFKKLPYFPQFSILASKRHLCIVPQVSKSFSPEYECRKLCEEDGCPYSNSDTRRGGFDIEDIKVSKNSSSNSNNSVPFEFTNRGSKPKFDLDDLKEYGRIHKICPYQLAFNIYNVSQFIFCPYNYILKANDDKNLLLDYPKNTTIAIFDEGHNIESTAREDASLTLTYKQVCDARQASQFVPFDDNYRSLFNQVQLIQTDIINFIERKRSEYDEKFQGYNSYNRPKYLPAESFKNVFVNIKDDQVTAVGVQMAYWLKILGNSDKDELKDQKMYVNDTLVSFFSTCADVFLAITPITFDFYRIVFVPDEKGNVKNDEFRLLCLKPSFLFNKINGKTRSIIITSGTLSPLESFAAELESSFPIRVSAPHVVDPSQVLTISINSYQNVRITSRFSTLQSSGESIYNALSQIISTTLRTVPGGSLLFAPSYYTKDSIIRQWKSTNMYDVISSIKPIVEEKSNVSAAAIINEYTSFNDGALLIGVCRGKISEGLDFTDDLSRIVYVFGIPYPGFKEADVELKMKYNDIRHSTNKMYLSGQEWYTCQAFRALFQSVGRCLRHTSDYGAIVFLDERIELNTEKLPTWLKSNFFKAQTADQAKSLLSSFYKQMRIRFPSNSKASFSFSDSKSSKQKDQNANGYSFKASKNLNTPNSHNKTDYSYIKQENKNSFNFGLNKPKIDSSLNSFNLNDYSNTSNSLNMSNKHENTNSYNANTNKQKVDSPSRSFNQDCYSFNSKINSNSTSNSPNKNSFSFNANMKDENKNSINTSSYSFGPNKNSNTLNSTNKNNSSFNLNKKQENSFSYDSSTNKPKIDSSLNSFNPSSYSFNPNKNSSQSTSSFNQNDHLFKFNTKQENTNSFDPSANKPKIDSSSNSFNPSSYSFNPNKNSSQSSSSFDQNDHLFKFNTKQENTYSFNSKSSPNQNDYSFKFNTKQENTNSFDFSLNKPKIDSSSNSSSNYNNSFTSASSLYKDVKVKPEIKSEVKQEKPPKIFYYVDDEEDDNDEDKEVEDYQDVCIIENEQECEPKEKESNFLTKMYCSVCSSPVISINNLDLADFKSIKIPEFFQILDMKEAKTKIMFLDYSAIHKDFTVNSRSIFSPQNSMTLIRRECSGCGNPLAVYVSDSNENNEFKKGEILFRQDMIAMKIDGKLTSLAEIA